MLNIVPFLDDDMGEPLNQFFEGLLADGYPEFRIGLLG